VAFWVVGATDEAKVVVAMAAAMGVARMAAGAAEGASRAAAVRVAAIAAKDSAVACLAAEEV